ncbi:hypothetical protein [Streptomyces sp. NPDC018693]|uniref:hypothetical protein n=1 Tax=unclassified Streptomyces TaxID=2593676 RepID=UPI003794E612
MPEQTPPRTTPTPTPTPAQTAGKPPYPTLNAFGWGCVALIAVPALAVLALLATLAWSARGSTDFPRTAPEDMANRVFQHSQEAYDTLGFDRILRPAPERPGTSPENTFSSAYCWDNGPLGLDDKTVDGAYQLSHSWALDQVPASRATPALRRLHQHLRNTGWKITEYREGAGNQDWTLRAQRDDDAERMSFTWYPDRAYFTGGATPPAPTTPSGTGTTSPRQATT